MRIMKPDLMPNRRTVIASSLLGSAALLLGTSRAASAATPSAPAEASGVRLALPTPTGPHPVGRHELYLVDTSRRDPWSAKITVRELNLTAPDFKASVEYGLRVAESPAAESICLK